MTDRKRTIEVDFLVDDKDKKKLKGIGDEAQGTVSKFDGMKGAIGGAVAAIGIQQIADFALELGQLAEQAQIAADSAEKVLGPALEGLHEDLEQTRLTMGLNSGELDALIAQFGLMTESLGLTDEAQAEFIEWLIQTGGELAAYKGDLGLSEEAVAALGATLRGEYDSLEQFGIKVGDAAVEERKLQLAADPANASLSDQQLELLALQQLITEKAGPAIGSLAEAQDGLAGKTNEATARFEDLKAKLGVQLLPVLEDLLSFLLEFMDSWDRLANPATFETTNLAAWLRSLEDFLEDAWARCRPSSTASTLSAILSAMCSGGSPMSTGPKPGSTLHRLVPPRDVPAKQVVQYRWATPTWSESEAPKPSSLRATDGSIPPAPATPTRSPSTPDSAQIPTPSARL